MNESVCSDLHAQLKGSIKECFKHVSVLGWKFLSSCMKEKNRLKDMLGTVSLYADDTQLDLYQRVTRCAKCSGTGIPQTLQDTQDGLGWV